MSETQKFVDEGDECYARVLHERDNLNVAHFGVGSGDLSWQGFFWRGRRDEGDFINKIYAKMVFGRILKPLEVRMMLDYLCARNSQLMNEAARYMKEDLGSVVNVFDHPLEVFRGYKELSDSIKVEILFAFSDEFEKERQAAEEKLIEWQAEFEEKASEYLPLTREEVRNRLSRIRIIPQHMRNRAFGYASYNPLRKILSVSINYGDLEDSKRLFFHELLHALSKTLIMSKSNTNIIKAGGYAGYMNSLANPSANYSYRKSGLAIPFQYDRKKWRSVFRWLDEAITESLAQWLYKDEVEAEFDFPEVWEETENFVSYRQEIRFVESMIEFMEMRAKELRRYEDVNFKSLLINAYLEDIRAAGSVELGGREFRNYFVALNKIVDELFGVKGMLKLIDSTFFESLYYERGVEEKEKLESFEDPREEIGWVDEEDMSSDECIMHALQLRMDELDLEGVIAVCREGWGAICEEYEREG